MKSFYCFLLAGLLGLCQAVSAQRFYTKVSLGYTGVSPFGNEITVDPYPLTGSGYELYRYSRRYTISKASLFTGLSGSFRQGYWVKENLGVELGIVAGLNTKKNTYQAENTLQSRISIYSKMPVMLAPAISYHARKGERSFFGSAGLCMPLGNKVYTETQSTSNGHHIYEKLETQTKFSLGFTATAGYQLPITKWLSIFGELSFMEISMRTQKMTLEECMVDGESILDTRYPSQKEVIYVKGIPVYLQSPTTDEPSLAPAYRLPFSNWGGNIGVVFSY